MTPAHFQAEADLHLENEMRSRQSLPDTSALLPQGLDTHNADLIMQSSDHVPFYVHKSILSMSSPIFRDMFSLPQPADGEFVDGLPVVRLAEEAQVLHNLLTMIYPIPSVIPGEYDKALDLLAVSQKYDMVAIQSSIRAEMKNNLRPLTAAATFRAYGIASAKGLSPETEAAARLTLDFPMTFESMGDALSTIGGWALRDLIRFRRHCRDNLASCLESLLDTRLPPIDIWTGCHSTTSDIIPWWLQAILSGHISDLHCPFSKSLLKSSSIRAEYLRALQLHVTQTRCTFCSKTHVMQGETFCTQVEKELSKALEMVSALKPPFYEHSSSLNNYYYG